MTKATIPVVKVKPLSPIFVHDGMFSFLNWHGDFVRNITRVLSMIFKCIVLKTWCNREIVGISVKMDDYVITPN